MLTYTPESLHLRQKEDFEGQAERARIELSFVKRELDLTKKELLLLKQELSKANNNLSFAKSELLSINLIIKYKKENEEALNEFKPRKEGNIS